jgi:hypothetical protein
MWLACSIYTPDLLLESRNDAGSDSATQESGATDASCIADLHSDPRNCGACGRDCDRGACSNGTCLAFSLVTGQTSPRYLALDNGVLFWTAGDNTIARVSVDGTGYAVIETNQSTPWDIRAHGANVVWSNYADGGVLALASIDGGAVLGLSGPLDHPRGLAIREPYVWFGTEPDNAAGSIYRVELDGGGFKPFAQQQSTPKDVVVDGAYVYWAEASSKTIRRAPVDESSGATSIVYDAGNVFGITVDTDVFWGSREDGGFIGRAPTDGGATTYLATDQASPRAIVTRGNNVYWTNEGGQVRTVSKNGGPVTTLASDQAYPWGIAVDDKFVYWTTNGSGMVMKVAR